MDLLFLFHHLQLVMKINYEKSCKNNYGNKLTLRLGGSLILCFSIEESQKTHLRTMLNILKKKDFAKSPFELWVNFFFLAGSQLMK